MHSALTRREMGAGLVVAVVGGSGAAAAPLFRDIRQMSVPGDVRHIVTAGHGRPGHGGARYRRRASAAETAYRVHSADGACWELAEPQVSPEQAGAAGDGSADDHEALMSAEALSRPLALTQGRTYRVGATLKLSVPVSGAGAIVTGPGFNGEVMIHGRPGFHLSGATLDGAGLAPPPRAWAGVGAPVGNAIFLEGAADAPLEQTVIEGVTLRNTAGGGLMAKFAHGIRICGLRAEHVQARAALLSSAVIELYHCDDGELRDCAIFDYHWKGYNIGACRRTVGYNCTAEGGYPGHAAHYIDDCEDSGYVDCSHRQGGYAAKASNALRPFYRRYRSTNSAGGLAFQSCRDFKAEDVAVADCGGAAFVVAASTAGPSVGGEIVGAKASWTGSFGASGGVPAPPAEAGKIGLIVTCFNAPHTSVSGLTVRGLSIERPFFGVHIQPAPGNMVDARFELLRIADAAQYGMIAYVHSLTVDGASAITGQGAFPAMAIYSNAGVFGGSVVIDGARMSGSAAGGSMVEIGAEAGRSAAFSSLTLGRDAVVGGRSLLNARLSGAPSGSPAKIDLHGNTANDLASPDAAVVTLGPGVQAAVIATDNQFRQSGGQPAVLRLGPRGAITSTSFSGTMVEMSKS